MIQGWEAILRRHVARVEFQLDKYQWGLCPIELVRMELALLERLIERLR